jgi:hypothetical protein
MKPMILKKWSAVQRTLEEFLRDEDRKRVEESYVIARRMKG